MEEADPQLPLKKRARRRLVGAIAFVTLPEGPTLLTNIIDCDLDALAIGQKVKLAFETREEQPVPVFRPA